MEYNFDEIIDRRGTDSVKWDLTSQRFGTDDLLPMWVADMDFRTPPFILDAICKRAQHGILGYTFRSHDFYHAIIQWMKKRHNWSVKKESILFCPGVVPSLNIAIMAYTQPGDKIIVQSPVYYPFFETIERNHREVVYNQLVLNDNHYTMDYDGLKRIIENRTKLIFISNPHNPGGRVWSPEELLKLAQICIEKDVLLISDEIHADIVFDGHKHTPLASISSDISQHVISLSSPSKTFNIAALSVSYAIIENSDLRKKMEAVINQLDIGQGNVFGAVALKAAYNEGEEWLQQLLNYLWKNIDYLETYINEKIPVIKVMRPESTYLVWLDCRAMGLNDSELKAFFVKKAGLGCNQGMIFGPGGEGFMRINLACTRAVLCYGLDKLRNAVNLYFKE